MTDCEDSALKNKLLDEIANAYITQGQLEEALATVDKIWQDFIMNNKIIMKVAEAYYAKDEPENAMITIENCNGLHYRKEIRELTQKYQDAIQ